MHLYKQMLVILKKEIMNMTKSKHIVRIYSKILLINLL